MASLTSARVLRPIGPNRTEVYQYHVAFPEVEGVTERINAQRVKDHQFMYGPAGYVGPDDHEMFSRIQDGYRDRQLLERMVR